MKTANTKTDLKSDFKVKIPIIKSICLFQNFILN